MSLCLAYMTFKDKEEAEKIGTILVKKQTVACFNIISEGHSIFLWEGALHSEKETFALAKLEESNFSALMDEVKKKHSYETPCILKIPIDGGHKPFLEWVSKCCKKP